LKRVGGRVSEKSRRGQVTRGKITRSQWSVTPTTPPRQLAGLSMTEVGLDNSKIPPGIDDIRSLEYYASGGDENAWLNFSKKKYYTNAFIVEDGKVFFLHTSLSNLKQFSSVFTSCF
jgi:hypothetical protein